VECSLPLAAIWAARSAPADHEQTHRLVQDHRLKGGEPEQAEALSLLVLLATFCSLRFGELAAITRADVDAEEGWVVILSGCCRRTPRSRRSMCTPFAHNAKRVVGAGCE
jgi:hypothetical protein